MIQRYAYLEQLKQWKDKKLIKVITWIRRCGKSTLFQLYIDYLKEIWVKENHIISINLESLDYDFRDYRELYNYINSKLIDNDKYYVFLDEIQNIAGFEKVVDALYIKDNVDEYITWSNAYLLSGELATLLWWRYIEIKMYPLSFKEYIDYYNQPWSEKMYKKYIDSSSFPYALNLKTQTEIDQYLEWIYNTIIVKDVAKRNNIWDTSVLRSIVEFMFSSIWSLLSVKKIADTLTSNGRKISVHTVENYLEWLTQSFIFNKVSRYDIKWKQYLQTWDKYYATDVSMRYTVLWRKNLDLWYVLENIVYLELIRRWYKVYIWKLWDKEVDFVAENNNWAIYFQVAYTVRDKQTLKRELSPLQAINDHYPKYILTMDVDPEVDYDWIRKINVLDWLSWK